MEVAVVAVVVADRVAATMVAVMTRAAATILTAVAVVAVNCQF
jgi:hypothetical protein